MGVAVLIIVLTSVRIHCHFSSSVGVGPPFFAGTAEGDIVVAPFRFVPVDSEDITERGVTTVAPDER